MILFIIPINYVSADEYTEVTDDIEIRYKWYKEIISTEGKYYPLRKVATNDKIDKNNIKYVGDWKIYDNSYCSLSPEYYLLDKLTVREYRKVYDASYVLIENVDYKDNIKIYVDNKLIDFKVISSDNNQVKINLLKPYLCGELLFYVDSDTEYTISLYEDLNFTKQIISKTANNVKISIPDETWINDNTYFYNYITSKYYEESVFSKLVSEKVNCAYKEKYVYKYDVIREYYDENYHVNVDGYIKDINDYKIYSKSNQNTNIVEIIQEKIVEVPKIEYIYIENKTQENDSSQTQACQPKEITETIVETKTETIEKEIFKIPYQLYIALLILVIIIVFLIIKLYRKYVEWFI